MHPNELTRLSIPAKAGGNPNSRRSHSFFLFFIILFIFSHVVTATASMTATMTMTVTMTVTMTMTMMMTVTATMHYGPKSPPLKHNYPSPPQPPQIPLVHLHYGPKSPPLKHTISVLLSRAAVWPRCFCCLPSWFDFPSSSSFPRTLLFHLSRKEWIREAFISSTV